MAELERCEYFLVEYSPSALRETRIAIGIFLFDSCGRPVRQAFDSDWRRLRCLDPQADLAMIAALPAHFEQVPADRLHEELRRMHSEHSGGLQISSPKGVLTADPAREFELLFQEHVEAPAPVREKRPLREGSRPWIHAQLTDALRRHGLWDRCSKDVSVAAFTAPGDGFRIDYACRPNGVTKYLHALSLERDWNQAKLLSYTFWKIREKTKATMTAIVADPSDVPASATCREILAGAQIAIQPLSLLDSYLEGVRREMRIQ